MTATDALKTGTQSGDESGSGQREAGVSPGGSWRRDGGNRRAPRGLSKRLAPEEGVRAPLPHSWQAVRGWPARDIKQAQLREFLCCGRLAIARGSLGADAWQRQRSGRVHRDRRQQQGCSSRERVPLAHELHEVRCRAIRALVKIGHGASVCRGGANLRQGDAFGYGACAAGERHRTGQPPAAQQWRRGRRGFRGPREHRLPPSERLAPSSEGRAVAS